MISSTRVVRRGRNFVQTVTLRNTGGNALAGPIFFVLSGLPGKVKLVNQRGLTNLLPPSPFVVVLGPGSTFAPGQSATLSLVFSTTNAKKVVYTNLVLAGVSAP
jgi:hypothetical protein